MFSVFLLNPSTPSACRTITLWCHEHLLTSDPPRVPSCDLALVRWHHFLRSACAQKGQFCRRRWAGFAVKQGFLYLSVSKAELKLTCSTHRGTDRGHPQTHCTQNKTRFHNSTTDKILKTSLCWIVTVLLTDGRVFFTGSHFILQRNWTKSNILKNW